MVLTNYNTTPLNLEPLGEAFVLMGKRAQEEAERQRRSQGMLSAFDNAFGGAATPAPTRGAQLVGMGAALPSMAGGGAKMAMPADPEIEKKFIGTLREGGLTNPFGLAAMAAYAQAESGYKPGNITGAWSDPSERGAPGMSGGILSWRADRLAKMRAQTQGADPVSAQAQFALTENPELTVALQNAKSPEEAHQLMANAWRFAGYNREGGENARRLAMTRAYVDKVGGGAPPTAVASAEPGRVVGTDRNGQPIRLATLPPRDGLAEPAAPDWQNATATPEQFEQQLAVARGGAAGPLGRPGAPPAVGQPPVAPVAPAPAQVPQLAAPRPLTMQDFIPPQQVQNLRAMIASGNPQDQKQALEYVQKVQMEVQKTNIEMQQRYQEKQQALAIEAAKEANKPVNMEVREWEGDLVGINPRTGERTVLQRGSGTKQAAEKEAKAFEQEGKLRDDYYKRTKEFETVQWGAGRVAAAVQGRAERPEEDSPASDLSLVFGFMKMLDPGSVVKETEQANAQNAAGVPDRVQNIWNNLLKGERLTDNQRIDFTRSANRLYGQAYKQAEEITKNTRKLAKSYGLNEERVAPGYERFEMPILRHKWVNPPGRPAGAAAPGVPAVYDTSGGKARVILESP